MNINFVKCYYYEIDVNFRHLSHKMTQYRFEIVYQFIQIPNLGKFINP